MATLLLDTNVLIHVLRGTKKRTELLESLVAQGDTLACCSVTITELFAGMKSAEEPRTERLVRSLLFLDTTATASRLAGYLKRSYAAKGIGLSALDMLIASTAISHNAVVVTENVKDFPMPELKLLSLPG